MSKSLYEVFLVYAEDRKKPVLIRRDAIIAESDEDAKVKSGIYSEVLPTWEADYLTIYARKICDVKVKAKPQEVKQV